MENGFFEFFLQRAGVVGGDAGDEHLLAVVQKFGGDFNDLLRRLARAKYDFGEIFPQRAVRVHLREAEIGGRRGLEGAQDFFAWDFSGAEKFEQLGGLGCCHGRKLHHEPATVTWENAV